MVTVRHTQVCMQQQHSSMCLDHCLHFKVLRVWALLVSCPPTLSLFPVSISNISLMGHPINTNPPQQDKVPHFLRVKSESTPVSYFINFQLTLPNQYLIALLRSFILIIKLLSCSQLTLVLCTHIRVGFFCFSLFITLHSHINNGELHVGPGFSWSKFLLWLDIARTHMDENTVSLS